MMMKTDKEEMKFIFQCIKLDSCFLCDADLQRIFVIVFTDWLYNFTSS